MQEILELAAYLHLPDIVLLCSAHIQDNLDLENTMEELNN